MSITVPNVFYKLEKLQIKQIQGSASLSLHKYKRKGKKYTAGDLKSAGSWEKLIHLDEGFRAVDIHWNYPRYCLGKSR